MGLGFSVHKSIRSAFRQYFQPHSSGLQSAADSNTAVVLLVYEAEVYHFLRRLWANVGERISVCVHHSFMGFFFVCLFTPLLLFSLRWEEETFRGLLTLTLSLVEFVILSFWELHKGKDGNYISCCLDLSQQKPVAVTVTALLWCLLHRTNLFHQYRKVLVCFLGQLSH